MPNGQLPELGARGAAPGTAYYSTGHRGPARGYDRQPGAGMKMCTVSSLVFVVFPNRVRGYGRTQLPVPGGAGARRLRGAGIRPCTVATEPSTVPGTDPTRRASNARGAQIQTLTTFRVASPPPNQARMRNHFFEAAVPGGTMAVPRIGRPTTT